MAGAAQDCAGGGVIDDMLDRAPIGWLQIRVILLCAVIAMLDGFDTQSIAFVAPVLGREWGITPDRFGLIFSAGLLGIMVGQVTLGLLSDRFGRRPVILLSTAMFGVLSFATLAADDWMSLLVLRFLTGIGLGGATPNVIALTAEMSPPRARSTMITVMFAGFPLGAALGAYISSLLIPAFGWQSVFVFGGIVPLVLLLVLIPWLSESPHHLLRTGDRPATLARLMGKVTGDEAFTPPPQTISERAAAQPGYRSLFAGRLRGITPALWIAYFNSLLMIYFLMSWMPTIAREAGMPLDTAIISSVFLNLGGAIGGIALGQLADRIGAFRALAMGYAVAGVSIAGVGLFAEQAMPLMALTFMAGLFTIGGQTAMNAATATLYPAAVRATALGSALAVGRIGSILGPTLGGLLLTLHWPLPAIFGAVALPAILTVLITLYLARLASRGTVSAE